MQKNEEKIQYDAYKYNYVYLSDIILNIIKLNF